MFYIVFKYKELLISFEPDVGLLWGMNQNVGFDMGKYIILKTSDSFPLIMSHMMISTIHNFWDKLNMEL